MTDKNKTEKRKHIIRAVVITVVTLVILALIAFPYWERFYPGDRITITMTGKVDGVAVLPDSENVKCVNNHDEVQDVYCNEPGVFSITTGKEDYESFVFTFTVDHRIIELDLYRRYWWKIDNCQLIYKIDSTTNRLTYTFIAGDGTQYTDTEDYKNGKYYIYLEARPTALR